MSAAGRIAALVFSRQALALLGIVLLGLVLWFGGPYIGVGQAKPLEPLGVRLTVTILLLAFLLFRLLHWPLSMVAATALCLGIWHFGPGLAFGEARPLEPEWTRLLAIGLIILLYSAYLLYRLWQALRANEDLLQKILHPRFGRRDSAGKERLHEVEGVFKEALARLRSLRTGIGAVRGLFQRTRYIYDLPWYMIIGTPGSGKTTAILNSGLKFPLSGQTGGMPGSGGTRNCYWWFSNEAVLLDTAGRYATHETDKEADQAEWRGFLKLLRSHRPKAPINGALLTISAEELAGKTPEELAAHAACLNSRLEEIRADLGINFPVYMLVTKMDFIKGFKEYFHNLTPEGRSQVWGFTMPVDAARDQKKICAEEMGFLARRLDQGMARRLHEEIDPARRRALFCLPGEMRALSRPLLSLLERLFPESRYGEPLRHMLRGVYFTSALQTTRVISADQDTIFRRFSRFLPGNRPGARQTAVFEEGAEGNKSYFIRNLLQKVVFPEASMVRPNMRWEMRWRLTRLTGHILAVAVAVALGYAFAESHGANVRLLEARAGELASAGRKLGPIENENREDLLAYALAQACGPLKADGAEKNSAPLSWRLGLYSGDAADKESAAVCRNLQDRLLLPRITARLEQVLSETGAALPERKPAQSERVTAQPPDKGNKKNLAAQSDPMRLYAALRVYLRLFNRERYDAADVLAWFAEDMRGKSGGDFFPGGERIYRELERCLTRAGGPALPKGAANERLIAGARGFFAAIPPGERIYERAKAHMLPSAPADFSVSGAGGSEATRLFTRKSGKPLESGVPGLFTRAGYHGLFNAEVNKYAATALDEDAWVMGASAAPAGASAFARPPSSDPARDLRRLYLQEYARRWEDFLADIYPVTGNSLAGLASVAQTMAGPGSPLPLLARAAARETTLSTGPDSALLDKLGAATGKAGAAAKEAGSFRPEAARELELVDMRFSALREAVYGSSDPKVIVREKEAIGPGLEAALAGLRDLAAWLKESQAAREAGTAPPPGGLPPAMQSEAELMPQFLKNVMRELLREGALRASAARGDTLGQMAGSSVGEACRGAITGYYPFNRKGQDLDPAKFARFFGPGGIMDAFFQKNLAPYADTSVSPWRYKQSMPGAPDLRPFEKAAAIREVFFGEEGGLQFHIIPEEMDSHINRLSIIVDGREWRYEHGPAAPLALAVPAAKAPGNVEITVSPRPRGTSTVRATGPFAGMRVLEMGKVESTGDPRRFYVRYIWGDYEAILEVAAPEQNPLVTDLFSSFTCPEGRP